MANPVVEALQQAAERIGKTLSKDAAKAVSDMYREAGKRTEDVVERITETDAEHAGKLVEIAEDMGRNDALKTKGFAAKQEKLATRDSLRKQFSEILDPDNTMRDLAPLKGTGAELPGIRDPKTFDPESLRGMDPDDVERGIPGNWFATDSKSGGGKVFSDPANFGRHVRTMPGYTEGNRPDPLTHGPYVEVSQGGAPVKVPLKGNPTL